MRHSQPSAVEARINSINPIDVAAFESHAKEELGCKDYPTVVFQKGNLITDAETAQVYFFFFFWSRRAT